MRSSPYSTTLTHGARALTFAVGLVAASCSGDDGSQGPAGAAGAAGSSCSVTNNGNGTKTIACTDGTSVTVNDGATGATGNTGATGGTGANGSSCSVVDNQNGTKTVSCTDGTSVTVSDGNIAESSELTIWDDLPGIFLNIIDVRDDVAGANLATGGKISVTFTLETPDGEVLPLSALDGSAIWFAGPSNNYQHILPAARDVAYYDDVATRSVMNNDGSFTYTFADAIPANYGVPLYNTTKFSAGELTGALQAGTYTVSMSLYKYYYIDGDRHADVTWATQDALLGSATSLAKREVVTSANCEQCHGNLRSHGGLFRDTSQCVTCHTAGAEDVGSTDTGDSTPVTTEFKVMLHKLHNGAHLPSVKGVATNSDGTRNYAATPTPYVVGGVTPRDFSSVTFPVWPSLNIAMPRDTGYSALTSAQKTIDTNIRYGVVACDKCHGDPDGAGTLAAPAQGNLATTLPTRAACGSCHDDVDWAKPYSANGTIMPPNTTDAQCASCHDPATNAIVNDHKHPVVNPAVNAGLKFNITGITGGSGSGGKFAVGDTPSLTFTVKNDAGADVPYSALDSVTFVVNGPTRNRNLVFPYASSSGATTTQGDFSGRLATSSTTGKGTMSKVAWQSTGTPVSDVLTVHFTSGTAFDVSTFNGGTPASLGSGTLPAATSNSPSGSSVGGLYLTSAAVAETVQVSFTTSTTFTVTGSVSGAMGSGTLASSVSTVTRFTSTNGALSFNLTVGTTAFATGNTINMAIFAGNAANPVLFAIVAGGTQFAAGDRFYYETVAPAASYTFKVPMDLPLELLGKASGSAGQTLTAANLPVYYGRQSLYERTGTTGTATTTTAAAAKLTRWVNVAALDAGLAVGDYVVLEDGAVGQEEYVAVAGIDVPTKRVWFRTPLRFDHPAGSAMQEATLAYRQEGTAGFYTLDPATGSVTITGATTPGNAFLLNYRTDAHFGWYRYAGDTRQATYAASMNGSDLMGEDWGKWTGKPYVSGTYTAAVWGYRNLDKPGFGENQTYRGTSEAATVDFLFGAATTIEPYALISSSKNCERCHDNVFFHGAGRRGFDSCQMCHTTTGLEMPANSLAPLTPERTATFRTFLHYAHDSVFPVFVNDSDEELGITTRAAGGPGIKSCATCHGSSDAWKQPGNRTYPGSSVPATDWQVVCFSCHETPAAEAHFEIMTSSSGQESCELCHGPEGDLPVENVHKSW